MPSTPKKTCQQIVDSGNHYLGALKGNHGNFFKALKLNFQAAAHVHSVQTGQGRVERRTVNLCRDIESLPHADQWAGLLLTAAISNANPANSCGRDHLDNFPRISLRLRKVRSIATTSSFV